MQEPTDEQLMDDFQHGDQEGIKMIFYRYNAQILNFCLRMLGNRADAEDTTGEVFLALFSRQYQSRPEAKFSTWLFTIARNCCIDRIRKRSRNVSLWFSNKGDTGSSQYDVADEENISDTSLENKEAAKMVKAAIGRLPLAQREALVLREYHCLSYAEIARVLGCSLDNTKVLIYRAREQLRKELASFMKEAQ